MRPLDFAHGGLGGTCTTLMHPYIFLDPDGTQPLGLLVIVAAATGVTYAHQCAGYATVIRQLEGFAVPVGDATAAQPLRAFFSQRFHGNPPIGEWDAEKRVDDEWTAADLETLDLLLGHIALWKTFPEGSGMDDERAFLHLDRSRLAELTEAWIPVRCVYGPGVLVFANSD
jgi:Family of unknown function (DUF6210)